MSGSGDNLMIYDLIHCWQPFQIEFGSTYLDLNLKSLLNKVPKIIKQSDIWNENHVLLATTHFLAFSLGLQTNVGPYTSKSRICRID